MSAGKMPSSENTDDIHHVKIIVFDDQNRVLAVKSQDRFIMPGGRIEWDDDDAETAARREVFEAANIALGPVVPVTIVKTREAEGEIVKTMLFAARMSGKEQMDPRRVVTHRFLRRDDFLDAVALRNDTLRMLLDAAYDALVEDEISETCAQTTKSRR